MKRERVCFPTHKGDGNDNSASAGDDEDSDQAEVRPVKRSKWIALLAVTVMVTA
jgi:hypothetical protein